MQNQTVNMMLTKQEARFIEFFRDIIPFGQVDFTVNVVDKNPLKIIVKKVDAEQHFNLNYDLTK